MKSILAFGLGAFLIACGGESADSSGVGGSGVGGAAGAAGTGAQPGTGGLPATGMFEWPPAQPSLVLTTQTQSQSLTGPAFSKTRLDFRATAGGFEAALGSRTPCSVAVSETEVTLSECVKQDERTIDSVSLPRAADGALTGTFQAHSRYNGIYQEDMIVNETIDFSGSVAVDQQPPDLFVNDTLALPWNGLQVLTSEGVNAAALVAAATVVPQSGSAPAITWAPSLGTPDWSGAIGMVGTFSDWAALADGPTFDLTLGPVPDLNGNSSTGVKAAMKTLAVGQPLPLHDFESGLSLSATGSAVLETSATVCESGACVTLGPGDSCKGAAGWIRGLLATTGKTKVRLRSRQVANASGNVSPFTLRLIAPTGEKSTASVGHFDSATTSPVLGLGYGSSFGDDVVPLPATGSVAGFEIYLDGQGGYFCNPGATVGLVLEAISAE